MGTHPARYSTKKRTDVTMAKPKPYEAPQFVDMDSHDMGGDNMTIQMICLEQVRRITRLYSREMRGGYWQTRASQQDGNVTNVLVYVPDTREELCNAIQCLHDILLPYFDAEIEENLKDIEAQLMTAEEDCIKATSADDKFIMSSEQYNAQDKVIVEQYKHQKLFIYRHVFRELSRLLNRKHYLADSIGYMSEDK